MEYVMSHVDELGIKGWKEKGNHTSEDVYATEEVIPYRMKVSI